MKIIFTIPILIQLFSFQSISAQTKTSRVNKNGLPKIINVGIINNKALSIPKPSGSFVHPSHLRISKEQIIAVQVAIDMNGRVVKAEALLGHPLLRAACETAARHAKFAPNLITAQPLKVEGLLIYKFKPDRTIDINVSSNDKDVIGLPIDLMKPITPFCKCKFEKNSVVIAITEIDEQGRVTKATAVSGHPLLRIPSEKAAIESKFLPVNIKTRVFINYSFEAVGNNSVKTTNIEVKKMTVKR